MTPILSLQHVEKHFPGLSNGAQINILRDLSFEIGAGESIAIVGRSGSGKSTLLNLLGLLDRPSSGSYQVMGKDTSRLSERELARLRGSFVGFIFQQFLLLDRRTALENVAEPLLFAGASARISRARRAAELLDLVELGHRARSMPHLMSGGEKQRVAIARAIVRNPKLLLADEPTGSLDSTTGDQIISLLLNLATEKDTALILVTHDRDIASRADRILVLDEGVLKEPEP